MDHPVRLIQPLMVTDGPVVERNSRGESSVSRYRREGNPFIENGRTEGASAV